MIKKKLNDLKYIRDTFEKKKIGLCHGVFDILHDGHIEHFKEAKKNVVIRGIFFESAFLTLILNPKLSFL